MKYSKNFERDFNWYLSVRHKYTFDGKANYYKNGVNIIQFAKDGADGKEAFYMYDSQGKVVPTKHPLLLYALFKTKGSINLHIKMYAEDVENGLLPAQEFRNLALELKAPEWFSEAVSEQAYKIWKIKQKSKESLT